MGGVCDERTTRELVAELGVRTIPGCDVAGVSWITDRRRHEVRTLAATDAVVLQADALQYEMGEGPGLSAVWAESGYAVQDIGSDPRWPRWGPQAARLGLRSMVSVRLATDEVLGALNLYSLEPGAADAVELALAQLYATYASIALSAVRRATQVEKALHSRHRIGMAQGILMERHRMTEQQAFAVLVEHSNGTNEKIRDVAARLSESGSLL